MLGLILNESEIINDIICYDKLNEKHFTCINLLIKYYYINNITDKLDIQERVIKDMERCDVEFKRARWEEIIKKIINKFFKDRKKFGSEVEMVDIKNVNKQHLEIKDKKAYTEEDLNSSAIIDSSNILDSSSFNNTERKNK